MLGGLSLSFAGAFYFTLSKLVSQKNQEPAFQEIESPSTLVLPKALG